MTYYSKHIFICTNQKDAGKACCANQGGQVFFDYMKKALNERELSGAGKFRLSKSGCLGRCGLGPCLVIYPEGLWYSYINFEDIDEIIEQVLVKGGTIERLLIEAVQ